ncbi:AraC family transcriptional regulator, partial [Salmonella enterica]|nr:AraC family transcriptional regulator [Salmonella enterica]
MSMGKLRQVFLFSNPDIEFIEYCLLPYINLPDSHSLFPDGCIDVFYIQNGKVELMFNTLPSKELSSGEFIFLSRQCTDYFIVSGGRDAVIIHARIILHGLYKDLLLHHGLYNRLHILNRNNSDALPAASEMIKLLLNMKRVQSGAVLFLEPPVTLFFVHLYLNEIAGLLLPFNNYDQRFSKLMLEIIKNPDYPW